MDNENALTSRDEFPNSAQYPSSPNYDVSEIELPSSVYFRCYRSDDGPLSLEGEDAIGCDGSNNQTSAISDDAGGKPENVTNQKVSASSSVNTEQPMAASDSPDSEIQSSIYFRVYRNDDYDSQVPDREMRAIKPNSLWDRRTGSRGHNRYHPYNGPNVTQKQDRNRISNQNIRDGQLSLEGGSGIGIDALNISNPGTTQNFVRPEEPLQQETITNPDGGSPTTDPRYEEDSESDQFAGIFGGFAIVGRFYYRLLKTAFDKAFGNWDEQ